MLPKQLSIWQKLRAQFEDRLVQPKLGDVVEKMAIAYRRRYYRHVFADPDLAFATIAKKKLRIFDLSYGGMRIERPSDNEVQSWLKLHHSIPLAVTILGETQATNMVMTSLTKDSLGFSCDARSPFSLLFLHRYLSFMDMGLSLKSLPKQRVDASYQSPQWLSYGNERGLVEVHMSMYDKSPLPDLHIYMVSGAHYHCILFRPPRKISISCKPRAELSGQEKKVILTQSLFLLLGMRQIGKSNRLDPYIAIAKDHLLPTSPRKA